MDRNRLARIAGSILLVAGLAACSGATPTAGAAGPSHATHLEGGAISQGFMCGDCHGSQGMVVDFSQGTMAQAGGAAPSFSATTQTCSSVYCHGAFAFGAVRGSNASPAWTDPTPLTCASCHGMPPTGHTAVANGSDPRSCNACHAQTVNADGSINLATGAHMNGLAESSGAACTSCHGTVGRKGHLAGTDRDLSAAPPVSSQGAPASSPGAHLAHLDPTAATALAKPVACKECHVVPSDAAHATTPPAQPVVFGALATAQGAAPSWVPGTAGCSATYCHGNFQFNAVTGSNATPLWTDTAPLTCTACHGMPPTGHPALAGTVTAATCSTCHPQSVRADGTINLAGGAHLNGRSDVSATGCTSCHGDANRTGILPGTDGDLASAPPVAPANAPAFAVGTHQGHMNPASAAQAVASPVACVACHVVPSDAAHATSPPASRVVFGGLAVAQGAAPTFAAGTAGCAASYCHGNFTFGAVTGSRATVIWTDTAALTCTSCHGMPPTGHPAVTGTPTAASCNACHPQSVNRDGTLNLAGHLNGKADGGDCTSCHGNPPGTGKHTISDHRKRRCDACHPSGYTNSTTVAAYHDNGKKDLGPQAGWNATGRTCANSCHGRESW